VVVSLRDFSHSCTAAAHSPWIASRPQRQAKPGYAEGVADESAACSLSDISGWRAGVLYPFAGGGRESGAAQLAFGGAMLLDLPGPAPRLLTDVADSILVIFRFGATMELGRSERTTMRPPWSYGVNGANTRDRKRRLSLPCSPLLLPPRAREALMMAGAGGATRARGRRATAIRFQQFGEGGSYGIAR
jgi:hypothetical protein